MACRTPDLLAAFAGPGEGCLLLLCLLPGWLWNRGGCHAATFFEGVFISMSNWVVGFGGLRTKAVVNWLVRVTVVLSFLRWRLGHRHVFFLWGVAG